MEAVTATLSSMPSPTEEHPEAENPTPCAFGDMVTYDKEGFLKPGRTFTEEQIAVYRAHTQTCAYCNFIRSHSPGSVFKRI